MNKMSNMKEESNNNNPELSIETLLKQKVRYMSLHRVKQFTFNDEIELKMGGNFQILKQDHWISSILVDLPGIKMQVNCHFTDNLARKLTILILGDSSLHDREICHSSVTEMCNIIGGSLKTSLSDGLTKYTQKKVKGTLSLPKVSSSYNIIVDETQYKKEFDLYNIDIAGFDLLFSSKLEIDMEVLKEKFDGNLDCIISCLDDLTVKLMVEI
jgi:chemotaxis protein CheY-P-specific phosphatase CheC